MANDPTPKPSQIIPPHLPGSLMGTDTFGNKYFEKAADPRVGRRKVSRYFVPLEKNAFDQEIAPEWESWLRGRRDDPPTVEEIQHNTAFKEMKQHKAQVIDAGFKKPEPTLSLEAKRGVDSFPKYDEYEISPGYDHRKPK